MSRHEGSIEFRLAKLEGANPQTCSRCGGSGSLGEEDCGKRGCTGCTVWCGECNGRGWTTSAARASGLSTDELRAELARRGG